MNNSLHVVSCLPFFYPTNWRSMQPTSHVVHLVAGTGLATSASSHALGECSPPISPITMSHTTPSIYPTSNAISHNVYPGGNLSGTWGPSGNPSSYNSTQYNSLGHHYSNKTNLMGGMGTGVGANMGMGMNALHNTVGMGTSLGHTSVLGKSRWWRPLGTSLIVRIRHFVRSFQLDIHHHRHGHRNVAGHQLGHLDGAAD